MTPPTRSVGHEKARAHRLKLEADAPGVQHAAVRQFLDRSGLELARVHARLVAQPLGQEIDPVFADQLVGMLHEIGSRSSELYLPRLELAAYDAERLVLRLRERRSTLSSAAVTILGDLLGSLDDQLLVIRYAGGEERFLDADTSLRRAEWTRPVRQLALVRD